MKTTILFAVCAAFGVATACPASADHYVVTSEDNALAMELTDRGFSEVSEGIDPKSSKARELYDAVRALYKGGYRKESTSAYQVLPLKLIEGYEVQKILTLAVTFKHKETATEQVLVLTFRPLFGNVFPRELLEIEKGMKAVDATLPEVSTLSTDLQKDGARGAQLKGLMADLKAAGFEERSSSKAALLKGTSVVVPDSFDTYCVKTTLVHPESGESRIVALTYKISGEGETAKKDLRKVALLKPLRI